MKSLKNTEPQNGNEPNGQGTTAREDARPTALNSRRSELVTIFENYGLLVAGFDALRSDAYEKQLAASSLEGLERVYEALLDPALGFKEVRERCPVWPEGSRLAGKLPSMMTLREIKERILLEYSVQDRMKHGDFARRLQEVGLDDEQFMAAASMILGSELLSAKLDGTPVMENLRVVDRILRIEGVRLRLRSQKWKADFEKRKAEIADNHRDTEAQRTGKGQKESVQDLAVGHQVSSVQQKHEADKANGMVRKPIISGNTCPTKKNDEVRITNGVILDTGHGVLDWLPALQEKNSLVDLIMGGVTGKAKG